MTVCIAATSKTLGAVVTVSDTLYSSLDRSVESGPPKFEIIGDWLCMYAAVDSGVFMEVIRLVRNALENGHTNVEDVTRAVASAYDDARRYRIEREILRGLMTYDDFMRHGLKRLGEKTFDRLYAQMEYMDLGLELLIAGFDEAKTPHVISSDTLGACRPHDEITFHAIGSGQLGALGSLHRNDDFRSADAVSPIVHRLLEARYCAQTSTSVGKERTIAVVLFSDGRLIFTFSDIKAARKAWEKERARKPARGVLRAIDSALLTPEDTLARLGPPRA